MGTVHTATDANEDVVMTRVQLTEQQKEAVKNSQHKPHKKYAILAEAKPALPKATLETADAEIRRKKPEKSRDPGTDDLPLYELVGMPGVFYEGHWKKGKQHGHGKVYTKNGVFFEGEFNNGIAQCTDGLLVCPDGSYYRGSFDNNACEGEGTFVYKRNGLKYEGLWAEDRPHGKGVQKYQDGSKYDGQFFEGKKNGKGTFTWSDGKVYEGEFKDGHMHGPGRLFTQRGRSSFNGTFQFGVKQTGRLETAYGEYTGRFENGLMHDKKGVFRWRDGKVYQGGFEFNEMHGQGVLTFPKNGLVIRGQWQRGNNVKVDKITS